jgi:hypothetical protein
MPGNKIYYEMLLNLHLITFAQLSFLSQAATEKPPHKNTHYCPRANHITCRHGIVFYAIFCYPFM